MQGDEEFVKLLKATVGQPLRSVVETDEYVTLFFEKSTFQWYRRLAAREHTLLDRAHLGGQLLQSATPGFDARIAALTTPQELLDRYRGACGALIVAAEQVTLDQQGKSRKELVEQQIDDWLRQSDERMMLAALPYTERPN